MDYITIAESLESIRTQAAILFPRMFELAKSLDMPICDPKKSHSERVLERLRCCHSLSVRQMA